MGGETRPIHFGRLNTLIRLCQKDKLVIMGTADPTRTEAPFDNLDYEIWGVAVAASYPDVKRLDVQFEMHTEGYWKKDPNVEKRLTDAKVPIYMLEEREEFPQSMAYPIDAVAGYRRYITNSIAYMIALAYHSYVETGKPEQVALYGVSMVADDEYAEQRPCCEYWLGRLEGAGVEIYLAPAGSVLVAKGLYGYENYNPICWDMTQRERQLALGISKTNEEVKKWELQKAKNQGALHEVGHWKAIAQRGEFGGEPIKDSLSTEPMADGGEPNGDS